MPESKHRKNRGGKRSRKNRGKVSAQDEQLTTTTPLDDSDPFDPDSKWAKSLDIEGEESLPLWYRATMIGLMILGLLWLVVWYISEGLFPMPGIGGWNIIVGFGIMMVGFFMTMKWK